MAFTLGKPKSRTAVQMIPLEAVTPGPHQTRQQFPEAELDRLAQSIDRNGLLNPIAVRKEADDSYTLIAGERRWRACRKLGWSEIPAILWEKEGAAAAALTLAENLHRTDLHYLEEAAGILRLITAGDLSQSEAASLLAMSQPTLCNKLRLLRLPEPVQEVLVTHALPERVARALLTLPDGDLQLRAVRHIAAAGYNVRQAETYIAQLMQSQTRRPYRGLLRDYRILFTTVDRAVEELRRFGVTVSTQKREEPDCVSYTIRIPKAARQAEPAPEGQMSLYAG